MFPFMYPISHIPSDCTNFLSINYVFLVISILAGKHFLHFVWQYEPVIDNEYLADFYADMKKYSFPLQVCTIFSRALSRSQFFWLSHSLMRITTIRFIYWINGFVSTNKSFGKAKVECKIGTLSLSLSFSTRSLIDDFSHSSVHLLCILFSTIYEDSVFAKVFQLFLSLSSNSKHSSTHETLAFRCWKTPIWWKNATIERILSSSITWLTLCANQISWAFSIDFRLGSAFTSVNVKFSFSLCRSFIWTCLLKKVWNAFEWGESSRKEERSGVVYCF
jgi:hypothetical protein